MLRVLKAEFLKLKRERVVLWSLGTVVFFASMNAWGAEIWDPDRTQTWRDILSTGTMFASGWWGIVLYSLAAAHLFGSEFADGTAVAMYTAPVRREQFLIAKFAVLAFWALALTVTSVSAHVAVALMRGASGFAWDILASNIRDNLIVALLLYLPLPVIALISMMGRGYLAPMIFATGVMTVSWAFGFIGWTEWFPWSMAATVGGGLGPPDLLKETLGPASWAIILAMSAAAAIGVFAYADRADARG